MFALWLVESAVQSCCGLDLGERLAREALVLLQVGEHGGVAAERAGGEESVVRGQHEIAAVADLHEMGRGGGLQVLVVAAEQLQAEQVVAGDEALDLVENGEGIEGAELAARGCLRSARRRGGRPRRTARRGSGPCRREGLCRRERACGRLRPSCRRCGRSSRSRCGRRRGRRPC